VVHAKDLALPEGATLQVDPEALVLHVLAERTAEQMEAELGEAAPEAAPAAVPEPPAAEAAAEE
jgi:large subunit ribosomal protein L25